MISPAIGANGKMVEFVGKEGGIYEVDFDGQNLKENKFTALKNLIRVLWSQDKTSFIGIYDGDGVKRYLITILASKQHAFQLKC